MRLRWHQCGLSINMIIKSLLIILLVQLVRTNPRCDLIQYVSDQIGKSVPEVINTGVSSVAKSISTGVSSVADVMNTGVNSASRIAKSMTGLIENFSDFKKVLGKNYITKTEEIIRRKIFDTNLAYITAHNELFKVGKVTFSLAINIFSDWTNEEYRNILLAEPPNATIDKQTKDKSRQTRAASCQFPDEKDWRTDGAVTPVKAQMHCGACWAFASVAAIESHYFIKTGTLADLSVQQLIDCAADDGKGCGGAFTYVVYEFAKKYGIVTSDKYPYKGEESGPNNDCKELKSGLIISGYSVIKQFDEEDLKDAVCKYGPVAAVINASSDKFRYLHNEIYCDPDCSNVLVTDLNHVVLVIGYGIDDETNEPYWLIKNSYGESWGDKGIGRIARNLNNFCGIASLASFPII